MKTLNQSLIVFSIMLLFSLSAENQKHPREAREKLNLSESNRHSLKGLRQNVMAAIQEGGEELRELLNENNLGRAKPNKDEMKSRMQAFRDLSESERTTLIEEARELSEALSVASTNEEKLNVLKDLVPILKKLPPPRRKPKGPSASG